MTKFTLEIDIAGEHEEASRVLNLALTEGVLQQHVNEAAVVFAETAVVTLEQDLDAELTRFHVDLEIDGNPGEAAEALDDALDAGVLQDFVKDHGDLTVEGAAVINRQTTRRR